MGENAHLVKRFFGSLRPGGPSAVDSAWVAEQLLPGEQELWARMSNPDKRHAAGVARDVDAALDAAPREVLAAALLHDVGKIASGLGTYLRVVATVSVKVAGRDFVEGWIGWGGVTRRIGLYCDHPRLGGDMLALAGSHELTVAWAREHHRPEDQWTIDRRYADAIDAADND